MVEEEKDCKPSLGWVLRIYNLGESPSCQDLLGIKCKSSSEGSPTIFFLNLISDEIFIYKNHEVAKDLFLVVQVVDLLGIIFWLLFIVLNSN